MTAVAAALECRFRYASGQKRLLLSGNGGSGDGGDGDGDAELKPASANNANLLSRFRVRESAEARFAGTRASKYDSLMSEGGDVALCRTHASTKRTRALTDCLRAPI